MDYESYYSFSGRLTAAPEQRRTESGKLVVNFNIAHEHQRSKKTDFYKCVAWDKTAELCSRLNKGANVLLSTIPTINTWTDKDGKKHSFPEFTVYSVFFLDKKKDEPFEEIDDIGDLPF